jgi:hypothetical protein
MVGSEAAMKAIAAHNRASSLRQVANALAACVPNGKTVACVRSIGPARSTTFQLSLDDPLFDIGKLQTWRSPIMALCGIPLAVVQTRGLPPNAPIQSALDNQLACYVMADPVSGFAPLRWQSNVGEVTILRLDRQPFTDEHCSLIWNFFDHLMDCYGNEDGAQELMDTVYSPQGFRAWLQKRTYAKALPW